MQRFVWIAAAVLGIAGQTSPVVAHAAPPGRPPVVVVRSRTTELRLAPYTYCWSVASPSGGGSSTCVDGVPPRELPDIGSPKKITVIFPERSWTFEAMAVPHGERCGRQQTMALRRTGATTHRLTPIGRAGDYGVSLTGRGPNGDVSVSFRWRSPVDGPSPKPQATISALTDHDGRVDTYGLEFGVTNLRSTPTVTSAELFVTSTSGAATQISLDQVPGECFPEGTVRFTGPIDAVKQAALLGPKPFTYDVALALDGVTHRARAVWPDDVVAECAPCVPLVFSPPLPRL